MDFTFGIITAGGNDHFIKTIVESIRNETIPNYEIIIVGACNLEGSDITVIPFDETIHFGWTTRKKNICCQLAKYENVVLLHDYVSLYPGWYKGFLEYGNNFKYCITRILNTNGNRYRDFCLYTCGIPEEFRHKALLPYSYKPSADLSKLLYISGAYYVIKKDIALTYPLNEELCMGMGEDAILSQTLANRDIYIECNPNSSVQFLKYKDSMGWEVEIDSQTLQTLESTPPHILHEYFVNQVQHVYTWILTNFNKSAILP